MALTKGHKLARGGARPGAGRKPKEAHALLARILGTVTLEDWQQMVNTTVSMAKAGSKEHLTLLFAYQFGKPVERKEHSGSVAVGTMNLDNCDSDELQRRLARAAAALLPR